MTHKHIKILAETHKRFEAEKLDFSPADKKLTQDEFLTLLLDVFNTVRKGLAE